MVAATVTKFAKTTKSVVLDQAIIAVMSASLIAPYFVPRINNVLDSIPILRDHKSISSLTALDNCINSIALVKYSLAFLESCK